MLAVFPPTGGRRGKASGPREAGGGGGRGAAMLDWRHARSQRSLATNRGGRALSLVF